MDQIEDLILTSANIPFTPWVMVNADRLVVLMDALRDCMPEEIEAAKEIVAEQDHMLEQTRQQAIALLQDAHNNRDRILSESELMGAIREEANRTRLQLIHELESLKQETYAEAEAVRHDALEEAEAIRASARQYASDVLNETEARLGDMHNQVRNGVQQLNDVRSQDNMVRGNSPSVGKRPARRQPRAKIASQQPPLMSSHTSSDEQVQLALRLLNQRDR